MDHQAIAQLLGNYGEFVGAIAVVATLLYLTKQVKQSNTAAETAAIQAFFDSTESITQGLRSKGDLIRRGIADWQTLSNDEQGDFNSLLLDWVSKIHMGYRLLERRVLDDQTYNSWESSVVSILRTSGGTEWWSNAKAFWPDDFRQKIDFMVSDAGSDIPPWDVILPWYGPAS